MSWLIFHNGKYFVVHPTALKEKGEAVGYWANNDGAIICKIGDEAWAADIPSIEELVMKDKL